MGLDIMFIYTDGLVGGTSVGYHTKWKDGAELTFVARHFDAGISCSL